MYENEILKSLEAFLKEDPTNSDAFFEYATRLFEQEKVSSFNFESIRELISKNADSAHIEEFNTAYQSFVKVQEERMNPKVEKNALVLDSQAIFVNKYRFDDVQIASENEIKQLVANKFREDIYDFNGTLEYLDKLLKGNKLTKFDFSFLIDLMAESLSDDVIYQNRRAYKRFTRKERKELRVQNYKEKYGDRLVKIARGVKLTDYTSLQQNTIVKLFNAHMDALNDYNDILTAEALMSNEVTTFKDEVKKMKTIAQVLRRKRAVRLSITFSCIFVALFIFFAFFPKVEYEVASRTYYDYSGKVASQNIAVVTGMKGLLTRKAHLPFESFVKVKIKNTYQDYPVCAIASSAFSGSKVKEMELPDTIIYIGDSAFRNSKITTINLPESLQTVGSYAFYNCSKLETVRLGLNVIMIGDYAFDTSNGSFTVKTRKSKNEISKILDVQLVPDYYVFIEKYDLILYSDSSNIVDQLVLDYHKSSNITIKHTDKIGYEFMGYYSEPNGKGAEYIKSNENYMSTVKLDKQALISNLSQFKLYAYYKEIIYNISYELDNGLNNVTNKATYSVTKPATFADPTKDGYSFLGWYDSTAKRYVTNTKGLYKNITLTAKWDPKQYSVSYANQGTADEYCYTAEIITSHKVTFNYRDGVTADTEQKVTTTTGLSYPEIPSRDGYVFTGWYEDYYCTTLYDFTSDINNDITLYAGWRSMNYGNSPSYLDATKYNSSNPYSFSTDDSSYSNYTYHYITALTSGDKYIYYKNSSAYYYYSTYLYIYNVTQGRTIYSNSYITNTYYSSLSFYANEGDVIYIRTYRYDASYTGTTFYLYFSGFSKPIAGGKVPAPTTIDSITVSFNKNGGTGSISSQYLNKGATLTYPSTQPTRSGYAFNGWYSDSTCTQLFDFTKPISKNITLYAGWTQMNSGYSTNYLDARNYNSSSNYYSFSVYGSGSNPIYQYITALTSGTKYIYYRNGDSSLSYATYLYIYNVTQNSVIKSNEYVRNTSYTSVSFEANAGDVIYIRTYYYNYSGTYFYLYFNGFNTPSAGGEVVLQSKITYDSSFSLAIPAARVGYTFEGWYDGEDGTGTKYTDQTGKSVCNWNKSLATRLYPYFTPNSYTITFDPNGGSVSPTEYTIEYNSTSEGNLPIPTLEGYTFAGWNDRADGTGTAYTSSDGEMIRNWDKAENATLYAQWTPNTYTVTCNVNGGDPLVNSTKNVQYNSEFALYEPTRTGYSFEGWYDGENGTGTQYTDEDGNSILNWDKAESATLYAKWTKNVYNIYLVRQGEYTVSFNVNGGDGSIASQVINKDSKLTYPTTQPTRSGYAFAGWYSDSDCTKLFDFSSNNDADITLYAGWRQMNSGYSTNYLDARNYNSSSNYYNFNVYGSSSNPIYQYITALTSGTKYIYYRNSSSSTNYATYLYIYNVTQGTTIKSDGYVTNTSFTSVSFNANAGDVICIRTYYSYYSSSTFYLYFSGFNTPTAGGGIANHVPTVSFNLNGGEGDIPSQLVDANTVLSYPTTQPTRSGYAFAGWYRDSNCTQVFNFTETISSDMVLYAGWKQMNSGYSTNYLDARNYNSSSNYYNFNVYGSSSSNAMYQYITALTSGTKYIYYRNSSSSTNYATYLYIYNVTQGTTIKSNGYVTNTSFTSVSFNANAGDVICIRTYYYYYSGSTFYLYFSGFNSPVSTSKGSGIGTQVEYDSNYTLMVPTSSGYTFAGWYDGVGGTGTQYTDADGNALEPWNETKDKVLYAKWV